MTASTNDPMHFWLHRYEILEKGGQVDPHSVLNCAVKYYSPECLSVMFRVISPNLQAVLLAQVLHFSKTIRKIQAGQLPEDAIFFLNAKRDHKRENDIILKIEHYARTHDLISEACLEKLANANRLHCIPF